MNAKQPQDKAILPLPAAVVSLMLTVLVGCVDYLAGYEYSFAVFYVLPIVLAVWYVNLRLAITVAILSAVIAVSGDIVAGAKYSSDFVVVWIMGVRLSFYILIIWLLTRVKALQQGLEKKVVERTSALTQEMERRETLEKELLAVSEREQHRIGHDLHDGLCQHLTGTSLAAQVLVRKVSTGRMPDVEDQRRIVDLTEEAIRMARDMARGLFPVQFDSAGLMSALVELAQEISKRHRIVCRFECEQPVFIEHPESAGHLYRIAQEAAVNAARHSGGTEIVIRLEKRERGIALVVADNGTGLRETSPESKGMGLQIMRYRATRIGALWGMQSNPSGTTVECRIEG